MQANGAKQISPTSRCMGQVMAKTRNPENEIVRANLKRFREEANMTTDAAAQASGLSVDNIRRYEGGGSGVPANALKALGEVYGHAMEDFFAVAPPKANLGARPHFFLRTLPGVEVDESTHRKLQEIIDAANKGRTKKASK